MKKEKEKANKILFRYKDNEQIYHTIKPGDFLNKLESYKKFLEIMASLHPIFNDILANQDETVKTVEQLADGYHKDEEQNFGGRAEIDYLPLSLNSYIIQFMSWCYQTKFWIIKKNDFIKEIMNIIENKLLYLINHNYKLLQQYNYIAEEIKKTYIRNNLYGTFCTFFRENITQVRDLANYILDLLYNCPKGKRLDTLNTFITKLKVFKKYLDLDSEAFEFKKTSMSIYNDFLWDEHMIDIEESKSTFCKNYNITESDINRFIKSYTLMCHDELS
jgi:hypothetical protein